MVFFFFFFQAEDGIRDYKVTGVQTCALPIFRTVSPAARHHRRWRGGTGEQVSGSCRLCATALGSTSRRATPASLRWRPGGFGSTSKTPLTCCSSSLSSERWPPTDGVFELPPSHKPRLSSSPRAADSPWSRLVPEILRASLERSPALSVERPFSSPGLRGTADRVCSCQPPAARRSLRARWACLRWECWT